MIHSADTSFLCSFLHVATAVHLGASRFLTLDARQQALAKHAGLELPGG